MYLFIENIIRSTFLNIKANKQVFFMSVGTIAVAFSILGLFFLVLINLNNLLSTWDKQVQLIVYLDDGISKKNSTLLEKMYKANAEIESFSFVPKDEAWKKFKNTFLVNPNLLNL